MSYTAPSITRLGSVREVTLTGTIVKVGGKPDAFSASSGIVGSFTTINNP